METVHAYAVRHKDGAYVNIRWEPVKSIKYALRAGNPEDLNTILNGHYKPEHPEDYYLQPIEISYKEVETDE